MASKIKVRVTGSAMGLVHFCYIKMWPVDSIWDLKFRIAAKRGVDTAHFRLHYQGTDDAWIPCPNTMTVGDIERGVGTSFARVKMSTSDRGIIAQGA